VSDNGILKPSQDVIDSFAKVRAVLGQVRADLSNTRDVAVVRPGYYYPNTGTEVPAVVIAVTPGTRPVDPAALRDKYGVPISVIDATVEEQLAAQDKGDLAFSFGATEEPAASSFESMLAGEDLLEFLPPKKGAYKELEPPKLPEVNEKFTGVICVSPEAGWGQLKEFLAGTEERLTVAMYQFTAPHIYQAIHDAVVPHGRKLELVLHPIPEKPPRAGVKKDDLNEVDQIIDPLKKAMKDRFEQSWATLVSKAHPDGLWASAYHIKVAVRDGEAVWLSSGNWQSSNQPAFGKFNDTTLDVPAGFQRRYNRDYHAVLNSKALADVYETYIKRDYDLTSEPGNVESFSAPDLIVPEEMLEPEPEELEFAAPAVFFPPLKLDGTRSIRVQPLLTPDNYAENALKLIKSATKSVWFQNQYINFRGTNDDFAEFRLLVNALKDKIDKKLDVRIICRDMMKQESVDVLVALGFPRSVMRFQAACHNKTIIIDGEMVMFGSHNWSNEGVKTNRDASLIFFDAKIAAYLAQVYEYDWNRLATAKPTATRPRVAADGEAAPPGSRRVPFSAVFDD
jgi:hypothetical protein